MKRITKWLMALVFTLGAFHATAQKTAEEWYTKAKSLSDAKKYNEAVSAYTRAIVINPKYADAYYCMGWCYNELEKYDLAIYNLKKATGIKKPEWVYEELGYALRKKEDYPEAIKYLEKAIALDAGYALAYKQLGFCFKATTENEKAILAFRRAATFDDTDGESMFQAGYLYNEVEKYAESLPWLKKSNEVKEDANTFAEMGYAYFKLDSNELAISNYERSLELNPEDAVTYRGLGDVYRLNFNPPKVAEAEKNYRLALQYNPKSANGHYGLGWVYNEQEKFDDAIVELEQAIGIDDQYTVALVEYGYSLYKKGKYTEALNKLNTAYKLAGDNKLGLYYSGLCYVELKDKAKADKFYNELKPIDAVMAEKLSVKIEKM